ncbi:MAG: hypothetical protein ACYTEE_11740 [Planctomycetota bacterium]|jgi:hypothetical protein
MKKFMLLLAIVAMLAFSVSAKDKQKMMKVNAPIENLTTQEIVGDVIFKTSETMFDVIVNIDDGEPETLVSFSVTTDRLVFYCLPVWQEYEIDDKGKLNCVLSFCLNPQIIPFNIYIEVVEKGGTIIYKSIPVDIAPKL